MNKVRIAQTTRPRKRSQFFQRLVGLLGPQPAAKRPQAEPALIRVGQGSFVVVDN